MSAHQEIITALAECDEALFCRVMEEHLLATNQRILAKETDDEPVASSRRTSADR